MGVRGRVRCRRGAQVDEGCRVGAVRMAWVHDHFAAALRAPLSARLSLEEAALFAEAVDHAYAAEARDERERAECDDDDGECAWWLHVYLVYFAEK